MVPVESIQHLSVNDSSKLMTESFIKVLQKQDEFN